MLAEDEPQLVVLDDVLVATDTGRLARILGIFEEMAQRLQVVVLTCHPERYRGMAGTAFFDLEAIVAQPGLAPATQGDQPVTRRQPSFPRSG